MNGKDDDKVLNFTPLPLKDRISQTRLEDYIAYIVIIGWHFFIFGLGIWGGYLLWS